MGEVQGGEVFRQPWRLELQSGVEEGVGAGDGARVGGVERQGEGAIKEVGEGGEGGGGGGEVEEEEGCYCLFFYR